MEGSWKELGYEIHSNVLSQDALTLLATQLEISRENDFAALNLQPGDFSGDYQVDQCYCRYGNYAFESLLIMLKPLMEKVTGKSLFPSHTYSRIYYNGAKLDPHYDSANLSYSMTLTIDIDKNPWPIYIKGYDEKIKEAILPPGSGLIYHGSDLVHWRNAYKERRQTQVFLHWVDDIKYLYDKRRMLGAPSVSQMDPEFIAMKRGTNVVQQI